ncbi:hypothetical protein [Microtetraspora glauca]|uniref:Tyr recombinase domain-containing protein n=1 Tax=Microtetraspora glauca TaxID=1996 RepID=A0ABV3G8A4_MICGL
MATFASLRWGEVAALRRMDLDLNAGPSVFDNSTSSWTRANWSSGLPSPVLDYRRWRSRRRSFRRCVQHLDQFTESDPTALVFTGANGGILRRSNFRRAAKWSGATKKLGVPGLHFHNLRHTGNTIALSAGLPSAT